MDWLDSTPWNIESGTARMSGVPGAGVALIASVWDVDGLCMASKPLHWSSGERGSVDLLRFPQQKSRGEHVAGVLGQHRILRLHLRERLAGSNRQPMRECVHVLLE